MTKLQIGLVPEQSIYFVIRDGFTSSIRECGKNMNTPFHDIFIYTSYVHRLSKRVNDYNPVILEVYGNSTLNDIKQQYPEHFI